MNLSDIQAECGDLFSLDELQEIFPPIDPVSVPEPEKRSCNGTDLDVIRAEFLALGPYAADLLKQLDAIGAEESQPEPEPQRSVPEVPTGINWPDFSEPAYQLRTRKDRRGIVWDFLPAGLPQAGDVIEDGGIWRLRPSINQCTSRYDRAVFRRIEAQRHHDAILAQNGFDALPTIAAKRKLQEAWREQHEALKASEDPAIQERDQIDAWRADAGREEYNASRRTTDRGANADLSGMTDNQKVAHRREMERQKKARQRAAKKAQAA